MRELLFNENGEYIENDPTIRANQRKQIKLIRSVISTTYNTDCPLLNQPAGLEFLRTIRLSRTGKVGEPGGWHTKLIYNGVDVIDINTIRYSHKTKQRYR